jgi:hypothetical protein
MNDTVEVKSRSNEMSNQEMTRLILTYTDNKTAMYKGFEQSHMTGR